MSFLKQLGPGQSSVVGLESRARRKLRDAQQEDFQHNQIPANGSDGSVVWTRLDNVPVMGRLVVMQHHKGVASNYDCTLCQCGFRLGSTRLIMSPPSATIVVGGSWQFNAIADMYNCYGSYYPIPVTYSSSWSSQPSSVASVSAGNVTGKAGGTAAIQALYNGCMAWSLIGYQCCCNSPGFASGAALVNVYTFTVNISPSVVAPLNAGTPNATTVTVQTNPFASGKTVTLQDVRVANTGGHLNHPLPNSNVSGTFSPSSDTTDSQGRFQSTYTVKEFGGEYQIKATIEGTTVTGPIKLWVQVQGLQQLVEPSGSSPYTHQGRIWGIHEQNWLGTSQALNGLLATADAYATQYPGKVPYNDISLPWGGKFDSNAGNWTTLHSQHRVGRNADINVCSPWGTQDQRNALWDLFDAPGNASARLDECGTNNCWHMTW